MNNKNKKLLKTIMLLTIIAIIITSSTYALLSWESSLEQRTDVTFTKGEGFSCSANGGGDINAGEITLAPTDCTTGEHVIKRTITTSANITDNTLPVYMYLWLEVNSIDQSLSDSTNLMYSLTTSSTNCKTDVVSIGSFNGKNNTDNNIVKILKGKEYTLTGNNTSTYYLYIWLDAEETNSNTMNQTFSLSLAGECINQNSPAEPIINMSISENSNKSNGLIPIVYAEENGSTVAKTISENDSNWYNYDEKKWANAVLVKDSGTNTRSYYQTHLNETINESDILAYFVWIPRYKYRIPNMTCGELTNPTMENNLECYDLPYIMSDSDKNKLAEYIVNIVTDNGSSYTLSEALSKIDNMLTTGIFEDTSISVKPTPIYDIVRDYNSNNEDTISYEATLISNRNAASRPIDIVFESKTTTKSTGDAVNTYYTHPAFTFGNKELDGIWVGKYSTSAGININGYKLPTIIPNVVATSSIDISSAVHKAQYISLGYYKEYLKRNNVIIIRVKPCNSNTTDCVNLYGFRNSGDVHLLKNSEWGAVAYLTNSKYGINSDVFYNNSTKNYTGRSNGPLVKDLSQWILNTTTYGSYTWDGRIISYNKSGATIGVYADDRTLGTNASTTGNIYGIYDMNSYMSEYVMGNYNGTVGSAQFMPEVKYYNNYLITNINECTLASCGGHALNETLGWYYTYDSENIPFVNSSTPWFTRNSLFNFSTANGGSNSTIGYRIVLTQ